MLLGENPHPNKATAFKKVGCLTALVAVSHVSISSLGDSRTGLERV